MNGPRFDDTIHAPIRFRICAILDLGGEVAFAALRDSLEVSDAVCSKHLKVLSDVGYVAQRKQVGSAKGAYPTTWVKLTDLGRLAFRSHLESLRAIVQNS